MLKTSYKSKHFKKAFLVIMISFIIQLNIDTAIAQDYYPLEIGNQWIYKIEKFDPNNPPPYLIDALKVTVESDTLLNGYHYFVLDTTDLSGGKIVRTDSNNIYYYDECDSSDVLFYRLNAEVNDYWMAKLNGRSYKIKLVSNYTTEYFGIFTTILQYEFEDAPWNFIKISKDIGPIKYQTSAAIQVHINILGCKLSNNYYGDIVSVKSDFKKVYTFELFQNHPNPFNSSTEIRYSLPQNKSKYHISLNIYNIRGRLVKTLVNQNQAAGTYSVHWNGRNMNGQEVSSGMYFYTLQVEDFNISKKMLLLE